MGVGGGGGGSEREGRRTSGVVWWILVPREGASRRLRRWRGLKTYEGFYAIITATNTGVGRKCRHSRGSVSPSQLLGMHCVS